MGKFLSEPTGIIFEKDEKTWFKLCEDFSYITDLNDTITVPRNFISDMASIPRLFWTLIGSPFDFANAALIHDFLCYTGQKLRDAGIKFKYSWAKAHDIFRQALIDTGIPAWKAKIMYHAVFLRWVFDKSVRW